MSKKIPSESQEQQRLVMRLRWLHPDIEFFSIPNGGRRSPGEAQKLKLEGVEPGVPDLFIAEPSGKYAGLFLELKKRSGSSVSSEQRVKHARYQDRGFQVKISYGADDAYETIMEYLERPLGK